LCVSNEQCKMERKRTIWSECLHSRQSVFFLFILCGECRISEMKRSAIELCTALFKGTFRKITYKTRNLSET
jgi:hypothetical protein